MLVRRLALTRLRCRSISFARRLTPAQMAAVAAATAEAKPHPTITAFLSRLNALPPVDPERVPVPDRRKAFATFACSSNGDLDFMPRIEDRMIPVGAGGDRMLRVYYPTLPSATAPAPAFLFLHGGGWHAGSITTHEQVCRRLALASGAVFASLDYRLAPEHPAPAAIEDCVGAWRWMHAHAAELGIAADRIGLAGDSAGANIVTAAALELCADAPAGASAAAAAGAGATAAAAASAPRPAALGLIYPSLDLTASSGPSYERFGEGFYLRTAAVGHYVHVYLDGHGRAPGTPAPAKPLEPTDPRVSPLLAPADALERLPPTYIATAGFDPILSDGEAFAARLGDAKCEYHCEADAIHAWLHLCVQMGPEEMAVRMARLGQGFARAIARR